DRPALELEVPVLDACSLRRHERVVVNRPPVLPHAVRSAVVGNAARRRDAGASEDEDAAGCAKPFDETLIGHAATVSKRRAPGARGLVELRPAVTGAFPRTSRLLSRGLRVRGSTRQNDRPRLASIWQRPVAWRLMDDGPPRSRWRSQPPPARRRRPRRARPSSSKSRALPARTRRSGAATTSGSTCTCRRG